MKLLTDQTVFCTVTYFRSNSYGNNYEKVLIIVYETIDEYNQKLRQQKEYIIASRFLVLNLLFPES